ncbi:hypothetical protein THRCLA_02091 [Thraustotheca clavata]|uniref:Uncharacterized protein n=1 Tax=Thraustotheca clavata TaxID=74557 RepID=A0A1W0A6A5_9STRA|nr:hypothetical protein THRCLA_02091 [Thraustotheca clavata]
MEQFYKQHGPFFINAIDPSTGDTHGHVSARAGWCFVLRWLWRRGLNINVQNKLGNTPAHEAAFAGHLEALQWLATQHLSFHIRNQKNISVIHHAAYGGHVHVLKWLLERDSSFLSHCDAWGNNALHYAAYQLSPSALMLLHSHGANLFSRNTKGETILHIAASHGNIKVLEWCYEASMDMNLISFQVSAALTICKDIGYTPAHCAAYHNSITALIWLADHGGNLFALDNSNKSAFDIACQRSLSHADKLHKYLRQSQRDSNQLWNHELLFESSDAIEPKDDENHIHSVVKTSQMQLVQALIERNITEPTYAKAFLENHHPEVFGGLTEHLDISPNELAVALTSISKWSLYDQEQKNNQLDT